jgi:hypothetical protein
MRGTQAPILVPFADVEHPVALRRAASAAHSRNMGEDFLATLFRPNETEPLLIVPAFQLTA